MRGTAGRAAARRMIADRLMIYVVQSTRSMGGALSIRLGWAVVQADRCYRIVDPHCSMRPRWAMSVMPSGLSPVHRTVQYLLTTIVRIRPLRVPVTASCLAGIIMLGGRGWNGGPRYPRRPRRGARPRREIPRVPIVRQPSTRRRRDFRPSLTPHVRCIRGYGAPLTSYRRSSAAIPRLRRLSIVGAIQVEYPFGILGTCLCRLAVRCCPVSTLWCV